MAAHLRVLTSDQTGKWGPARAERDARVCRNHDHDGSEMACSIPKVPWHDVTLMNLD